MQVMRGKKKMQAEAERCWTVQVQLEKIGSAGSRDLAPRWCQSQEQEGGRWSLQVLGSEIPGRRRCLPLAARDAEVVEVPKPTLQPKLLSSEASRSAVGHGAG